jgi:RNA polymerase sigma-70 factor (ECF subfamily)
LDQLIEALPAPLRETIVLRELHELDYREIAQVTGVPIGTVMSRLHRARSLLLRAWDAKETGDVGIGSRSPHSSPFPAASSQCSHSR